MTIVTFTLSEVADTLKVSRRTVVLYIKKGQLKAFRLGTNYRVTQDSLSKFIHENTIKETKS